MSNEDVIKEGYLRRLKTQKKRYFVLRLPTQSAKARLEYYESEKKFRSKGPPKRVIYIASCLNIAKKENRRSASVFALYTREDVFGLIADSEAELNSWLACLRTAQSKEETLQRRVSTWHVTVKPRGLGTSKDLAGQYDLQLSCHNLTLVKVDTNEMAANFELVNVRRCGHIDCFFFLELGRSAVTGTGEMWMQVDDQIIAQNMHEAICGKMQSISSTDAKRPTHRRCDSEGKKPKGRTELMAGVVLPTSREHSNTIPGSPRTRTGSSDSTRTISFESPKTKLHGVLYHLLPRRKSKDVSAECLADSSNSCQDGQGTDFYSIKEVICSTPNRTPSAAGEESQPEYVNIRPGSVAEPLSLEDYMDMDEAEGSRRQSSDSYMDMVSDQQTRESAAMGLMNSNGGYIYVTPPVNERDQNSSAREQSEKHSSNPRHQSLNARSDYVQRRSSSSPRQLKTGESALPNKPNIREFVNIKKSPTPSPSRRRSSPYVPINSLGFSECDTHSYENFFPGTHSRSDPSSRDVASESRYYVNFSPGKNLCGGSKFSSESNVNTGQLVQSKPTSEEELHSYVNFRPGKSVDEDAATSHFRKHSLESVLIEKPREYLNFNTGVVSKSKSAADLVEYVNFAPGIPLNDDHPVANGCATTKTELREYMNFSPGITPYETWRKSPRAFRRESEPARLQTFKYPGIVLDSTGEDEERAELNYIMVDLKQHDSPSHQRRRPPNIDLTSCHRSAVGPKSAPLKTPYTEIDFRKSHGLMQARLETRVAKT